jgi:c(7)-type cytochrome triheme protein
MYSDHIRGILLAAVAVLCLFAVQAHALDLKAPPLTPLAEDGIHDPAVETINTLQDPARAMQALPKDRRGEVNWVQTLERGLIAPRKSVTGDPWAEYLMQPMDLDILMTNTAEMPHVLFPHRQHTEWLTCSNCHPAIFIPQRDANPINMTRVLRGEFCGRGHDKVAFSLWTCERCHSVPHEKSPKPWW